MHERGGWRGASGKAGRRADSEKRSAYLESRRNRHLFSVCKGMEVALLKRAHVEELAAFDVHDLPAHCAEAAWRGRPMCWKGDDPTRGGRLLALAKLGEPCLRPDAFMWTNWGGCSNAAHGGVHGAVGAQRRGERGVGGAAVEG